MARPEGAADADPGRRRPKRGRSLLTGLTLSAAIGGYFSSALAAVAVPPVTVPATQERHQGKIIFDELITPDLQTAEKFYTGLLGWSFQDVPGLSYPYAQAYNNGAPVAGLVEKPLPAGAHLRSAWLNFVSVPNVDAALASATAASARTLTPAHDVPGRGREAVIADPQGAVFAMLASASGDQPETLVPAGGWIWHSITAPNPDQDAAFYKSVFGYESHPMPDAAKDHALLASGGYARASLNALPPDRPGVHPHWLGFVRVADTPAALAKVAALGGRVLAGPWTDRHGGHMAIVADPNGAPFGLMEWSETATQGMAR